MKVLLRNPRRELEIDGPLTVRALLQQLEIDPETVLVIRDDTLAAKDERLDDDATIEIRPVMSGGMSGGMAAPAGSRSRTPSPREPFPREPFPRGHHRGRREGCP